MQKVKKKNREEIWTEKRARQRDRERQRGTAAGETAVAMALLKP